MKNDPVLVDMNKLRELVAGLDLGDKHWNEYIDARWLNYVEWWDSRATGAKRNYHRLRAAVVVASALIPAMVGLRELGIWKAGSVDYSWIFAVASILASLVVAICAGLESLYNYGDIWREKRNAVELLKSEGFAFLQLAGKYAAFENHAKALKTFADSVEQLIRSEIKEYIQAAGTQQAAPRDPTPRP